MMYLWRGGKTNFPLPFSFLGSDPHNKLIRENETVLLTCILHVYVGDIQGKRSDSKV